MVRDYFKLQRTDRDNQSNYTMLYNIYYLQTIGFDLSNELNSIDKIELSSFNINSQSTLETNFKDFIINKGIKIKQKSNNKNITQSPYFETEIPITFPVGSYSFQRNIDFVITSSNKTIIFIELDGQTHFLNSEQTEKIPQTLIRDTITQRRLMELKQTKEYRDKKIYYVSLSANEFNTAKCQEQTISQEEFISFLNSSDILRQQQEKISGSAIEAAADTTKEDDAENGIFSESKKTTPKSAWESVQNTNESVNIKLDPRFSKQKPKPKPKTLGKKGKFQF